MQGEDTRQEEQIQCDCDRRQGQQSTYHPIQLLAGPVRVGIQLPKNASQKLSIVSKFSSTIPWSRPISSLLKPPLSCNRTGQYCHRARCERGAVLFHLPRRRRNGKGRFVEPLALLWDSRPSSGVVPGLPRKSSCGIMDSRVSRPQVTFQWQPRRYNACQYETCGCRSLP